MIRMFRYCIEFYSGKIMKTMSSLEPYLPREKNYIQVLGFEDSKSNGYGFFDLESTDLSKLKGTKIILINHRGLVKKLQGRVKRVWKEKL